MKIVRALAVAAAVFATTPAPAQVVDLSKTTCKEFLESGKDGIMIIWSWLYGYYAAEDADPVVDFNKLTAQGQKLAEFCKSNPAVDVITAADPIYER